MAGDGKGASAVGYRDMANAIRALSMEGVQKAKSGHPGMPMGMADVATVLFSDLLKFDPADPGWPNRDRFVLSAGHGSMLLYSLLYLTGYPDMDIEQLKNFRQLGSRTAGHPEFGHAPGIETTTGPLGQGIANAVGMALAERLMAARVGPELVDHHTYCIAGDGCLMEGISHEAISLAGHLKLGKLIVLWDDNSISIDGPTDISVSDDQAARFAASGWNTLKVDGHDPDAIASALKMARSDSSRPWLIACKTVIGFGAPNKGGTASAHGEPLGDQELQAAREKLGWTSAPFEVPSEIMDAWRGLGAKGAAANAGWKSKLAGASDAVKALFDAPAADKRAKAIADAVSAAKSEFAADEKKRATRVWSQMTLEKLVPSVPELVGGSADLTPSNGTRTSHHTDVTADDFSGSYVRYGVREHGMAAAMNGMALHGGIIPYGATFLVFTDYCRPSIRLTALMKQRVIYVMTHDSIGLGEDGPTHQPIEHLAALRAIPNLLVLRPADALETAEAWEIALGNTTRPTVMALTRQGVPTVLRDAGFASERLAAKGAYVVSGGADRQVTLMATGSEVGLAVEAAGLLSEEGIKAAVVSMPSFELFREQPDGYQAEVLGTAPRVAVEAGVQQGWHEWLGSDGRFIGLSDFGASAPGPKVFEHFGITAANVVLAAKAAIT